MYVAVYRCKLCRKRFEGEICSEKEAEKKMVFHIIGDHYCKDGSIGVPELLRLVVSWKSKHSLTVSITRNLTISTEARLDLQGL